MSHLSTPTPPDGPCLSISFTAHCAHVMLHVLKPIPHFHKLKFKSNQSTHLPKSSVTVNTTIMIDFNPLQRLYVFTHKMWFPLAKRVPQRGFSQVKPLTPDVGARPPHCPSHAFLCQPWGAMVLTFPLLSPQVRTSVHYKLLDQDYP